MSEQTSCPTCGAPRPAGTDLGACPRCLLQAGLADSDPGSAAPHASAPAPEEIAPHFPQLEILEIVGQGGMGVVYRARQLGLDRIVALKILSSSVSNDPAFANRFTREARTMARLDHPNIVRVHDFGEAKGRYFILMEYVDGSNLRQVITAGTLEPREALLVVPQICDALQYAHDRGVVHRDIKPENVLIDREGCVKITDFGLAKLMLRDEGEQTLTNAGQVMGTPQYMAPEQYRTPGEVDHRADIYSLGVVFYEMLTGDLPMGRFAPPSRRVEVDVRLDEVVLRTLERERELRYQQAVDVSTELTSIASSPAPVPPPPEPAPAAAPPRLSRLALVGFLCLPAAFLLPTALAFTLVAFGLRHPGVAFGFTLAALLFLLAFGLGLAGWIAVSRRPRALAGKGFAVAATVASLPLLLLTLTVFGALFLTAVDEMPEHDPFPAWDVENGAEPGFPTHVSPPLPERAARPVHPPLPPPQPGPRPEPERSRTEREEDAIRATWAALIEVASRPKVTPADLARFVSETDRSRVTNARQEDRDRWEREGLLGLAWGSPPGGVDSLKRLALRDIDFETDHRIADVLMDAPDEVLGFRMIRDEGRWRFALGPVLGSLEALPTWTTPAIVHGGVHGHNLVVDRWIQTDIEILWSIVQHAWEPKGIPHRARIPASWLPALMPPTRRSGRHDESPLDLTEEGKDGKLGLLFLDSALLPEPLAAYTLTSIDLTPDGQAATVTATAGDTKLLFPVVREQGRWWLGLGPVGR